jgi:hypothetical protein
MLLGEDGANKADAGSPVREDAHDVSSPAELFVGSLL